MLYGHTELVHQEEREIARHARDIKVFREYQHDKNQKRCPDPALRQPACRRRNSMTLLRDGGQFHAIPSPHPCQYQRSQHCRHGKTTDSRLSERYDNQGCQQRPDSTAAISSHLENRLCQTLFTARSQLRHARRLRMKNGRAPSDDAHGQKYQHKIISKRKQQQSGQREAHAQRERIRTGMAVGITPHKRLQDGGSQLEHQRNDTNLRKGKPELILYHRINGRNDRLYHVVQQMGKTDGEQNGISRALRHVGLPFDTGA